LDGEELIVMWHTNNGMGWWMVFGMAMMIVFWLGVIWLVVSLLRPRVGEHTEDAVEIARRRYARGEISREEFERLRQDLTSHPTAPGS
jgi:putative membrane protein